MTDWLEICRLAVGDLRGVLTELPTRVTREPIAERGVGGDDTSATTARRRQRSSGAATHEASLQFRLVSEELGERPSASPRRRSSSTPSTARSTRAACPSSRSPSRSQKAKTGDVDSGYVYTSAPVRSGRREGRVPSSTASRSARCGRRTRSSSCSSEPPSPTSWPTASRPSRGVAERSPRHGWLTLSLC